MAAVHPIPSFLQLPIDGLVDEAEPRDHARPRDAALVRGGSLRLTHPVRSAPDPAGEGEAGTADASAGRFDRVAAIATWRSWLQSWEIEADPAPVIDALSERLGDAHRHFHKLERVAAELAWLEQWRDAAQDPVAVGLATWFRYAILDSARFDNEARSAGFARIALAGLGLDTNRIRQVRELIVSTREGAVRGSPDARLLADIARARFADPVDIFEQHEEALRAESAQVVDLIYWRRRTAAIRAMVIKPRVYLTDLAHDRLEAAARDNLSRRIQAR